MRWYRRRAGAVVVTVRLTPKADRDAVGRTVMLADGTEALQARVRALPAEGEANAALAELIARTLRVPKSSVEIVGGKSQRLKTVSIAGDPDDLARRLDGLAKGSAA